MVDEQVAGVDLAGQGTSILKPFVRMKIGLINLALWLQFTDGDFQHHLMTLYLRQ